MKAKHSNNGVKGLIIGVILLLLIVSYYFYLSNKRTKNNQEEMVEITAVQDALMRDMDTSYPPTPREVVNYCAKLAQCLYNETYTEEEFKALAAQIQRLYDDELIANKTQEQYLKDLKWDIQQLKEQEITISSYSLSSSIDVEEYKKNGYSWASLYCTFTLKRGTNLEASKEIFLLRKDEDNHWKIYGWKLAGNEENSQ